MTVGESIQRMECLLLHSFENSTSEVAFIFPCSPGTTLPSDFFSSPNFLQDLTQTWAHNLYYATWYHTMSCEPLSSGGYKIVTNLCDQKYFIRHPSNAPTIAWRTNWALLNIMLFKHDSGQRSFILIILCCILPLNDRIFKYLLINSRKSSYNKSSTQS